MRLLAYMGPGQSGLLLSGIRLPPSPGVALRKSFMKHVTCRCRTVLACVRRQLALGALSFTAVGHAASCGRVACACTSLFVSWQ